MLLRLITVSAVASALLPPSSRIEKNGAVTQSGVTTQQERTTSSSEGASRKASYTFQPEAIDFERTVTQLAQHYGADTQTEYTDDDDLAINAMRPKVASRREPRPWATKGSSFQDYPDYELPARQAWPPSHSWTIPTYTNTQPVRPIQLPLQPANVFPVPPRPQPTEQEYVSVVTSRPPLRIRSRRPSETTWTRPSTYPSDPLPVTRPITVPRLPTESFPPPSFPSQTTYVENSFDGYSSYRKQSPQVRPIEPEFTRFELLSEMIRPDYSRSAVDYSRREEYGTPLYGTPTQPSYGYSYSGYIERQSRMYPIMLYSLENCPACNSAKRLLAINYADVASHFLELVGDEEWQRQLYMDLYQLTGNSRFPFIFVCGQFIGGSSDLHEMHRRGILRIALQQCAYRE